MDLVDKNVSQKYIEVITVVFHNPVDNSIHKVSVGSVLSSIVDIMSIRQRC